MGHHLDKQGRFQSDKYSYLPPDKIILSFKDPLAKRALKVLADSYRHQDPELSQDIYDRLKSIHGIQ